MSVARALKWNGIVYHNVYVYIVVRILLCVHCYLFTAVCLLLSAYCCLFTVVSFSKVQVYNMEKR
jgi:hypothetical protein